MQAMAPVLDLETGTSRKAVIQFSDRFDVEPYRSLCGRTRRWATRITRRCTACSMRPSGGTPMWSCSPRARSLTQGRRRRHA